jgi:hypothetical protein
MSDNLYEQAIAEAKQLREMAEQNAKNKIIEAVAPRIKALIEAQIMGEQDEVIDDDIDGVDLALMDDEPDDLGLTPMPEDELLEPPALEDELSNEDSDNTTVVVNAQGDVNISVAEGRDENRTLDRIRTPTLSGKSNLTESFISVRRKAKRLDAMLQGLQFNKLNEKQRTLIKKAYQELLSEALLTKRLLLKEGANKELTTSYTNMIKEIKEMTKRSSAIFRRLFEIDDNDEMATEMHDEMHEEDEEMELGGDEELEADASEGDVDLDGASSALEDLGAALGLDVEVGEGSDESEEEEAEEEEAEEIDLGEFHEADETDEDDEGVDEVYEIDENILRREIARLRKIREGDGVDAAVLDDFGGGDDEGDMFVDVNEDDLLNALADELGSVPSVARESRSRRRPLQTRRLRNQNTKLQTENKKLQKQLTEMNLFNAKLLYVNKLMQNRNVSSKQQRAIVEALDNAKTIREAKFLYEGLAKSLTKQTKKLTESADRRLLSSSSKPTRGGSPALNEDAVASRWATLAGIRK